MIRAATFQKPKRGQFVQFGFAMCLLTASQAFCCAQDEVSQRIRQAIELFNEYDDIIERVSFWNLLDGQSWLNYFPWDRTNYPLLFDRERNPKPAFKAEIETLDSASKCGQVLYLRTRAPGC